jgi:putative FmdB family regulatory protein
VPIYRYKCGDCESISEILKLATDQEMRCERCGSANLEKLITTAHARMTESSVGGAGLTCCGREERCVVPPCSDGECNRG